MHWFNIVDYSNVSFHAMYLSLKLGLWYFIDISKNSKCLMLQKLLNNKVKIKT